MSLIVHYRVTLGHESCDVWVDLHHGTIDRSSGVVVGLHRALVAGAWWPHASDLVTEAGATIEEVRPGCDV